MLRKSLIGLTLFAISYATFFAEASSPHPLSQNAEEKTSPHTSISPTTFSLFKKVTPQSSHLDSLPSSVSDMSDDRPFPPSSAISVEVGISATPKAIASPYISRRHSRASSRFSQPENASSPRAIEWAQAIYTDDNKRLNSALRFLRNGRLGDAKEAISPLFVRSTGLLRENVLLNDFQKQLATSTYGFILTQIALYDPYGDDDGSNARLAILVLKTLFNEKSERMKKNMLSPQQQAIAMSSFGIALSLSARLPEYALETEKQQSKASSILAANVFSELFDEEEWEKPFDMLSESWKGAALSCFFRALKNFSRPAMHEEIEYYATTNYGQKYFKLLPAGEQIKWLMRYTEECIFLFDEAYALKYFFITAAGRSVLESNKSNPLMLDAIFMYYSALNQLSIEARRLLPPVPMNFYDYIHQHCDMRGAVIQDQAFMDVYRVRNWVVLNIDGILASIRHLNFNDIQKVRKFANELGLLFNNRTGQLSVKQYVKRKDEVMLNYGILRSILMGRPQEYASEEDMYHARIATKVLEGLIRREGHTTLSKRQMSIVLFNYLNALFVSCDPAYFQMTERSISEDFKYLFRTCTFAQQEIIRLNFAKCLFEDKQYTRTIEVLAPILPKFRTDIMHPTDSQIVDLYDRSVLEKKKEWGFIYTPEVKTKEKKEKEKKSD